MSETGEETVAAPEQRGWSEDWAAVLLGLSLLLAAWVTVRLVQETAVDDDGNVVSGVVHESALRHLVTKVPSWSSLPFEEVTLPQVGGLLGVFGLSAIVFGAATLLIRRSPTQFWLAFIGIFFLALLAKVMASQEVVKHYGLSYALWALLLGLIIANTVGTPRWLRPGVQTELYIKTALVIYGAEVLLSKLLALGLPGVFVAWVVTPIVLITTYWFGQKILKIESKTLNIVVAADMSVCGVSAAIATAAACKAKKEELSVAVAMSLLFTVVMMIVLPAVIRATGMDEVLGGAWLGGTIDATGAVAAAGEFLGDKAANVAITVKMIQNILIGVTAFGVAVYWAAFVEKTADGTRVGLGEIWRRFPKFVIGFLGASLVFSILYAATDSGPDVVQATADVSKTLRGWWFALAFVSIGLDSNFREFAKTLSGGKPLLLYVCGQTFNLCLTLGMAWLMFRVVFKEWVDTALAG